MTRRIRRIVFLIAAAALACTFFAGYAPLPPLGFTNSPYADLVNSITVPERRITDAVTAVNFDIRGFDTLGEEFILFTSVVGLVLLMRRQSDEPQGDHEDHAPGRKIPRPSEAVQLTSLGLIPITVLFGLYIVTHGQVSPGGGFQGGVILASAPLLLYLGSEHWKFRRALPRRLAVTAEAFGAATYILVGGVGLTMAGVFLENVLPLGSNGSVTGGGMVPYIDLGVGAEVSGGICLALLSYLEELIEDKEE